MEHKSNGTWEYNVLTNSITLTRYLKHRQKHVTIPDEIGGKLVAGLGGELFKKRMAIESVSLPKGLIFIGDKAFDGCTNLTICPSDLPKSLNQIGSCAFRKCKLSPAGNGLFTFPDELRIINERAFFGCKLDGGLVLHKGIGLGAYAFSECDCLTYVCCETNISTRCFEKCLDLKSAFVNGREIGTAAFADCADLENLTLGENVRTIWAHAFKKTSLEEVVFPESLEHIGLEAFQGVCHDNPKRVSFEKTKNMATIANPAFYEGTEAVLPSKIQSAIDNGRELEPEQMAFVENLIKSGLRGYLLLMALANTL